MKLLNLSGGLKCRDGSVLVDQESAFRLSGLRHGNFHEAQYGFTDTVSMAGRVHGSKATGTLKVTDRQGKVGCASPTLKFTGPRR
jgi:hypothetical protein